MGVSERIPKALAYTSSAPLALTYSADGGLIEHPICSIERSVCRVGNLSFNARLGASRYWGSCRADITSNRSSFESYARLGNSFRRAIGLGRPRREATLLEPVIFRGWKATFVHDTLAPELESRHKNTGEVVIVRGFEDIQKRVEQLARSLGVAPGRVYGDLLQGRKVQTGCIESRLRKS